MTRSDRSAGSRRQPKRVREGLHKIVFSEDTIVALSTPIGRSGIGVIRVSGSGAEGIADRFLKPSRPLIHRQAVVGRWETPSGVLVDEVIVVLHRGPHSYTGEDVLEINAHGNPIILNQIVCLIQAAGARAATPGEFTLRAVGNGKMDLIQAEAVRDFIEAQTDAQARTAMQQLAGSVSRRIAPVKEQLVGLIAHMEAGIDFAEDDVELPDIQLTAERLMHLRSELESLQETYSYGRLLNAGVRIVIAGRPNVGKSSLFNRLVAADRAIVTDIPGTTRDVVTESAELDGIPLRFFDTAGIRESADQVERIGVRRTIETLTEADLVLVVVDGSVPLSDEDRRVRKEIHSLPHLIVANKSDLKSSGDPNLEEWGPLWVSAKNGEGLEALREAMRGFLGSNRAEGLAESVLTSARQNDAVLRAMESLRAAASAAIAGTPHEMVLLDLYETLSSLNELTGETTTEDILGRIFSTFCIGK
jgi:tRNA modification GTPase